MLACNSFGPKALILDYRQLRRKCGNPHWVDGMKMLLLPLLLVAADVAAAQQIPLPRPRPTDVSLAEPAPVPPPMEVTDTRPPPPSACRLRLTDELAIAPSMPSTAGPGECGGADLIRLEAVLLPDKKGKVTFNPPAIVRCGMAEALVHWIREDIAPAAAELGSQLKTVDNSSYECRGRNRVAGAKISHHGLANALDVVAFKLANGKAVDLTNSAVPKTFRDSVRHSACTRFTTVLGPGSDRYHENHVHLDLAERRGGYRLCQWDVREPAPPQVAELVPLPPPRPKVDDEPTGARSKPTPARVSELVPLPLPRPKIEDAQAGPRNKRGIFERFKRRIFERRAIR
jgi:hypothetical protein